MSERKVLLTVVRGAAAAVAVAQEPKAAGAAHVMMNSAEPVWSTEHVTVGPFTLTYSNPADPRKTPPAR